jgi:pyruvate dehydrogenase E2 component (dihydrolipoamide acetyltransferase)
MIQEVKLPEVSENIESGDVVKVLVKAGDVIELEQPVIELETDKAMFEVPSTAKGKVVEVKVKEGESINIGSVILTVETDASAEEAERDKKEVESKTEEKKEEIKEEGKEKKEAKQEEPERKDMEEKEAKPKEASKEEPKEEKKQEKSQEEKKTEPQDKGERISTAAAPASPSVRRLARELGLDINDVPGTGPSGRISEDDVKAHVKQLVSRKPAAGSGGGAGKGISYQPLPDFSKWGEIRKEPMSKVRRLTAESMTYAWTTIPMVTQFDKADITSFEEFRKKYNKTPDAEKGPLTVTSLLVKLVTAALKKFPQFNSSIDMESEEVIFKSFYNIGIAVDTDRGLLVPVIKNSDKKNIHEISVELTDLAARTRDKKIKPDEMEGGTFTISNLGGIGGTAFTPIVYSPQVAILGVSRASKEPVFTDNGFSPKLMLPLSLTYDHRIIDGADAARFLRWICEALEHPYMVLLDE